MSDRPRCKRCGRVLKDSESVRDGMGKTCYSKHLDYVAKFLINLFDEPVAKIKKKSA